MPLEINEISIQMRVGEQSSPVMQRMEDELAELDDETEIDYEAIVAECVRRVLQVLKHTKER